MNGRMMKRLVCFLIAAMLCVGTVCECGAATQVTDLRNFKIESSGVPWATYRKIAQRLHLKRSYSSAFDVSYRNANIIVGFARHPSVYGKKRYYSYALNRGSKKLRFYGVILGDTLSTVKRKLRKARKREALQSDMYSFPAPSGAVFLYLPCGVGCIIRCRRQHRHTPARAYIMPPQGGISCREAIYHTRL